jgi:hypothetical protein
MTINQTAIFIHYLHQLKKIVQKISQHQNDNPALLQQSLHTDMLPLIAQIRTATNFSLRTCCPLANRERITFENQDETYAGLEQQITETIGYLQNIAHTDFQNPPEKIQDQAGTQSLELPAAEYLHFYALPNFFFHLSMVYAIARNAGVPLGKADFDGYHSYPDGFSFVSR